MMVFVLLLHPLVHELENGVLENSENSEQTTEEVLFLRIIRKILISFVYHDVCLTVIYFNIFNE